MTEEDALVEALRREPEDLQLRLVYADWLEERGHPGADYLRAEVALARADGDEASGLRHRLIELAQRLPPRWRDQFEQPGLLLAPPAPFLLGWYAARDVAPRPYRSLPNLELDSLSPGLPWLSGEGTSPRLDQAEHERDELAALAEVQRRAARLKLALPYEFESFARDFSRRGTIEEASPGYEVCLHDAVVDEFPQVGEGYLALFFADMNYGNPHQAAWALYLVPGAAWHCVVAFELADGADHFPRGPEGVYYCAPSFQAFLYRWWLEGRDTRR